VDHPGGEAVLEEALLAWLRDLGYHTVEGGEIAPDSKAPERVDFREVLLVGRLRAALQRINPTLSGAAIDEAIRILRRADSPSALLNNRRFHRHLIDGVAVEVSENGQIRGRTVRLVDFDQPDHNDWLAVNQFTLVRANQPGHRRLDIVLFINGLPVAAFELKDPGKKEVTVWSAFNQFQTYQAELPDFFAFNELMVISDGVDARLGCLTAPAEWFHQWRTIDGSDVAPRGSNVLEVLTRGVFERKRLLDLFRHFIVFEDSRQGPIKKVAGYHQFHATRRAVATTVKAATDGDRRGGVVWHTQGSGKSLTMVFYAGKLAMEPELRNPTLVVITDRNDLDDQLFGVFAGCADVLRQTPVRARDRANLRELLQVASGGVVFTTIQKFLPEAKGDKFPMLSDRRNVIVIADEAHRTHYGFVEGFARNMRSALPNATFIAFTGTPVELEDRDTRLVFGDYIDVYDIRRAEEDGAIVPINFESRLAKLDLPEEAKPRVDEQLEEVTEAEESEDVEKLKVRWTQLEAVAGTRKRLELVAQDLLQHWERRRAKLPGKAMIVCMSRRICVELYDELVKLRPEWDSDADGEGTIKVIMTGSATDPAPWQTHIRNSARRKELGDRFKDPDDPFEIVLVRDMWLTGFDAPSLHTMYIDKPMRGHTLMQAIARVNRVFRDKPGGLVVEYIPILADLRRAVVEYTRSGGEGRPVIDQDEIVAVMLEKIDVLRGLFGPFDYAEWFSADPAARMKLLPEAQEHVLAQENGRERFVKAVLELSKAFALAAGRDEAEEVASEVGFFQTVRSALSKLGSRVPHEAELDRAVREIVASAIAPEGVIDIFEAAGLAKPDLSILSEEFLAQLRGMPRRHVAAELLRKLLDDEIHARMKRNVVQARLFSEMLETAVRRYEARAIETVDVIEELIQIARELRAAEQRGEQLGLTDEELAFYDALETNDSAVKVLGHEALRAIARELTDAVRRNVSIDWAAKESVRARLRVMVRRILKRHGYPPDKAEKATRTVLEQAEQLGLGLVEEPAASVDVRIQPFHVLQAAQARPGINCVPLYSLQAAAGGFGDVQAPEVESWVVPHGRWRSAPGLFVAQVAGESMNRRIPNGAYCLFRHPVTGSRQGRVLLVQHHDIADPELGGTYTVKVWESDKTVDEDGWRHREIRLMPDSDDASFPPIVIRSADDSLQVIAEMLEVLPGRIV